MKFSIVFFERTKDAQSFIDSCYLKHIWNIYSSANGFHQFIILKEDETFARTFHDADISAQEFEIEG